MTNAELRELSGAAVVDGQLQPALWRRMKGTRGLGAAECLLIGGQGTGSSWNFEWAGGSFTVEFRADG